MKRLFFISLIPLYLCAESVGLKTYIEHTAKTNGLIKSKEISIQAQTKQVEAAQSNYWPTLDIGADYTQVTPNNVVSPGQTSTAFARLSMDLYDGGRRDAIVRSHIFLQEASAFEKAAFEKSLTLEITRYYYGIQTLKASIKALNERAKELKAQIKRVKKFKTAGLSTQEDIDKLIAVYENNNFTIENTKLSLETSEENLKLISGISAKHLKRNYFLEPRHVVFESFDRIKILQANANAIGENANALDAGYMPQVNISDTYYQSHFDDVSSIPGFSGDGFLLDHQNEVTLSVNMRLFDHGKMAKESESVRYKKLALLSELAYAKKEQKMQFRLAGKSLKTSKSKLKSAKSALTAATSTYTVIRQKFEAGLVDNIAFLDALTQRTLAEARYKATVYDYEISKSIYYYYAGKSPKEFIR